MLKANTREISVKRILTLLFLVLGGFCLVSILLPPYHDHPLSPISRARSDMRSLSTALETYFIDHHAFPPMVPMEAYAKNPRSFLNKHGNGIFAIHQSLTTPVPYVTSLIPDDMADGLPFAYYLRGEDWILYSPGRDGDYDLIPLRVLDGVTTQPSQLLISGPWTFDPSNGTADGAFSSGDVWRVRTRP
jgi:hypothetical protein